MIVTEKEAAKKWCPLARSVSATKEQAEIRAPIGATSANVVILSDGEQHNLGLCIGTLCMAWRDGVFPHQRNLPESERTPGVGYCGAFGKVEQ